MQVGTVPYSEDLQHILDEAHHRFNQPSFIEEDPICIPHQFTRKEDIEISAFFTALIAWGRRSSIIQNAQRLMDLMDQAPHAFVTEAGEKELMRLEGFVHRTFNSLDARGLILSMRNLYLHHGGLETAFRAKSDDPDQAVFHSILQARELLTTHEALLPRTHKHLANPAKGSSAKRINMFLRWMVRKDKKGVDFGIWDCLDMAHLLCPLDVHTGNVGRKLGLLTRKQNDWKSVLELSRNLRMYCPEDPIRYDFSLFGLGAYKEI